MYARLTVSLLLALLAISVYPAAADAWGHGGTFYSVTAWDYQPHRTYLSLRNTLPYYTLHPPVYYSDVIRRPYGWSPYAAFPSVAPPTGQPPVPLVISNPYVAGTSVTGRTGPSRPAPLRIVNPYVAQPGAPGVSPAAVSPPQPRVVYPSTLPK